MDRKESELGMSLCKDLTTGVQTIYATQLDISLLIYRHFAHHALAEIIQKVLMLIMELNLCSSSGVHNILQSNPHPGISKWYNC